jgi:ferredoxin-NADP reductase
LVNPKYTDERGNGRFVGFVNIPSGNMVASVVRLGPSAFKRTLAEADIGSEMEISGIDGKMILPEDKNKVIVIVTGGIGITPIKSCLDWIKVENLGCKIILLYSNTNRARAIFFQELTDYEKQNPNFKLITTMTQDGNWGGEKRRIDANFIQEFTGDINDKLFYVTGTPRFVPDMVKHLRNIGVEPSQMKFEIFTGY